MFFSCLHSSFFLSQEISFNFFVRFSCSQNKNIRARCVFVILSLSEQDVRTFLRAIKFFAACVSTTKSVFSPSLSINTIKTREKNTKFMKIVWKIKQERKVVNSQFVADGFCD